MPTPLDGLIIVPIAAVVPANDYWCDWPRFRRRLAREPGRARVRWDRSTMVSEWALTALAAWAWRRQGRSWQDLGFRTVGGARLWVTIVGLALLLEWRSAIRGGTVLLSRRLPGGVLEAFLAAAGARVTGA